MKVNLLTITLLAALSAQSQTNSTLDFNNASIMLSNEGTVFHDFSTGGGGYEIPKGDGISTLNSGQFWFAGKQNGQINTSLGGTFNGPTDVMRGPYSSNGSYTHPSYQSDYSITICQSEIEQYKTWIQCAMGVDTTGCASIIEPSNDLLNRIYAWPAHGDVSLGQAFYLAPFFDNYNDGSYNPSDGDYPIIKGCCATYMIQNDHGVTHTNSQTAPIGIEMHYMFYQYGANNALFQTTFVDVLAINRGTENYTEFAHGFMIDADLGNASDDYFGSDSSSNTLIFYNGDNLDDGAYLSDPPAIGVVGLAEPITSCVPISTPITNAASAWDVLNGRNEVGSSFMHPNGYLTNFPFTGNPNDNSVWTEVTNSNAPSDRKAIMSTFEGPFNSGDSIMQTYAISYSRVGDHLQNAEEIINLSTTLQNFYDTESDDGCGAGGIASVSENTMIELNVHPNPSHGVFKIIAPGKGSANIVITNIAGEQLLKKHVQQGIQFEIDLSNFADGIYQLHFIGKNGNTVKRIAKV